MKLVEASIGSLMTKSFTPGKDVLTPLIARKSFCQKEQVNLAMHKNLKRDLILAKKKMKKVGFF